jgi:hypothetical protein
MLGEQRLPDTADPGYAQWKQNSPWASHNELTQQNNFD